MSVHDVSGYVRTCLCILFMSHDMQAFAARLPQCRSSLRKQACVRQCHCDGLVTAQVISFDALLEKIHIRVLDYPMHGCCID